MKVYQLTCSPLFGEENDVTYMLKGIDSIKDLRSPIPYFFLIKTYDTAPTLAEKLLKVFPGRRFLLSELTDNRQGYLPKDTWDFIKDH